MRPNIGIINALVRITGGLAILAWITSKMVRRPYRDSYILVALLGAMKVAEGILRYCPLTDLFERYQDYRHDEEFEYDDFHCDEFVCEGDDEETYNPS